MFGLGAKVEPREHAGPAELPEGARRPLALRVVPRPGGDEGRHLSRAEIGHVAPLDQVAAAVVGGGDVGHDIGVQQIVGVELGVVAVPAPQIRHRMVEDREALVPLVVELVAPAEGQKAHLPVEGHALGPVLPADIGAPAGRGLGAQAGERTREVLRHLPPVRGATARDERDREDHERRAGGRRLAQPAPPEGRHHAPLRPRLAAQDVAQQAHAGRVTSAARRRGGTRPTAAPAPCPPPGSAPARRRGRRSRRRSP